MARNHVIQLFCCLAAAACLAGAVMVGGPINRQRADLQLTYNRETDEAIPPQLALTQAALGSFRGIAVDFLWYRANKMKQEGKFREANQLSQWICRLQPRFEKVWVFHAWNMAYNISVATHTLEERWSWVQKGINLLREEGIKANPKSVVMKKELAWIFFHKMGQMSDDAHWFYRRRLAAQWQTLLGSPEGLTTEQVIQRIRDIAAAPDSLDELLQDEATAKLVKRLGEIGYEPDERLIEQIGRVLMFGMARDAMFFNLTPQQISRMVDRRVVDIMGVSELTAGFSKLVSYLRRRILMDKYNMDPAYMLKLMAPTREDVQAAGEPVSDDREYGFGFGPIDWRHPAAHSAYWSAQGIEHAKEKRIKQDVDQLNTDRLIIHSMQEMMRTGRLTYDPISDSVDMLPDPRFIEAYRRAEGYGRERLDSGEFRSNVRSNFDDGYNNFMLQAIFFSYMYGEKEQSQRYHTEWRDRFGDHVTNRERKDMTLEELVFDYATDLKMWNSINQFVDAMLRNAFLQGMAQDNTNVFDRFMRLAKHAYDSHQASKSPTKISPEKGRLRLTETWEELVAKSFMQIMIAPRISIILRARIWRRAGSMMPDLLRHTYDQLKPVVYSQAIQSNMNPQRILPEPPGMEQFRQTRQGDQQPTTQDKSQTEAEVQRQ